MNISIFCGGRGSANIIQALLNQTDYQMTLLINAYDDGKSTGRLREYIPGLLGPSDFRKNVSTVLEGLGKKELAEFLEFRFSKDLDEESLINYVIRAHSDTINEFTFRQFQLISQAFACFEFYERSKETKFSLVDCPIGNILISGLFLDNNYNFNLAIKLYQELFLGTDFRIKILNVTDGENLYLVARSDSGVIFCDEEEIVINSASERIRQIALVPDKSQSLTDIFFSSPKLPKANPEVDSVLSNSQMIIYGPGTQASSLLPSYLTEGILTSIRENTNASKIFISNLVPDYDDPLADVESRLDAFAHVASTVEGSFSLDQYVTNVFSELPIDALQPLLQKKQYSNIAFQTDNWLVDDGKHLGPAIVRQVASLSKEIFLFRPGFLSLLIIGVNDRTSQIEISVLIQKLALELRLDYELFFATDSISPNIADYDFSLGVPVSRVTLQDAFVKSRGDILAVLEFPHLYTSAGLIRGIKLIQESELALILGSRNLRITNLKNQIRNAYSGQPIKGFVAYWGSLLLSISFLLKNNRFITDPLSGIKVFLRPQINTELAAVFAKDPHINILKYFLMQDLPILQYDVEYRTELLDSKYRHRIFEGLMSLKRIWFSRDLKLIK